MMVPDLAEDEMHELHAKLTLLFDGWTLEAVLFSCATIMAHAYLQLKPEKREPIRERVDSFISRTIRDLETCGQRPN